MFKWVSRIVTYWLFFIVVFMSCLLCHAYLFETPVNKSIVITLLATTTLNILGLPFVITRSLFK
jgi:exopolysaccharide biosynthesis protein